LVQHEGDDGSWSGDQDSGDGTSCRFLPIYPGERRALWEVSLSLILSDRDMMGDMSHSPSSNVLDRVLDPFTECLTPEVAQRIVDLRADAETQARVDELASKANDGALSDEERTEYDRYREAYHFVTILQAKARTFLDRRTTG